AHHDRLAVRHAALEAAGIVRGAPEPLTGIEQDLVVDTGARTTRRLESHADLASLDGLDRAEGLREAAIEAPIPLDVGPEPDGAAERDDFEDAAERVAFALGLVDGSDHRGLGGGVGAPDFGALRAPSDLVPGNVELADARAADLRHVTQHRDAEFGEEPLRDTRDRHASGCLPGAGALQHITDVSVAVLHRTGEVGVPGARTRDLFLCGPWLRDRDA